MVVAIDDNPVAEAVVQTALQDALGEETEITLLTVVSGDSEDDWVRHGDAVKGRQWGRRLESFARLFRQSGLDPLIRIRSGKPADLILATAESSAADRIIMGPARRNWLRRLSSSPRSRR